MRIACHARKTLPEPWAATLAFCERLHQIVNKSRESALPSNRCLSSARNLLDQTGFIT